jgi:hypothetical protein
MARAHRDLQEQNLVEGGRGKFRDFPLLICTIGIGIVYIIYRPVSAYISVALLVQTVSLSRTKIHNITSTRLLEQIHFPASIQRERLFGFNIYRFEIAE